MRIRVTKTGSKNLAVQVVYRKNSLTKIVKHLGTAHDDEELVRLKQQAGAYIENNFGSIPIFPQFSNDSQRQKVFSIINSLEFTTSYHSLIYETLRSWYGHLGFDQIPSKLLMDLAVVRLIEPMSKLRSVEFLASNFGVKYSVTKVYRELPKLTKHKELAEQIAIKYAISHYGFSFSLVFYDVSTLYFESFTEREIQKCGFSKDHKHNQPQLVIGLLVNERGFPVTYSVFEGNTFEGKTMLPVLEDLCKKYQIKTLTVIADAGMLSAKNIDDIVKRNFSYIVGARLGKITLDKAQEIHRYFTHIQNQNRHYTEISRYGTLLVDYSLKRAKKDKHEREKQVERAKAKLKERTATKATRFIKATSKATYSLNTQLIKKAELMDGIKGYYTNLDLRINKPELIIARYHDLWYVEKAFRMAKTDLAARPIYHFKKKSIETHLLIVFVSLCLGRALEITSKISLAKTISLLWKIEDITLIDQKTGDTYVKRSSKISSELRSLLTRLKGTY